MIKSQVIGELRAKNFGLNKAEFDELCISLRNGEDKLFEQIYLAHFATCQRFLRRQVRASRQDCYDATMDTLLNFRRALILGKLKYGNLKYLFSRMAYFQLLKRRKEVKEFTTDEIETFQLANVYLEEDELEEKLMVLEKAIGKLNEEQQLFLNKHYKNQMKLVEIAEYEGISDATIRKRKQRILARLRNLLNI